MKIIRNKLARLIPKLTLLFLLLIVLTGYKFPKPTDNFFVNDYAGVITAADEQEMMSLGVSLEKKVSAQVVAVTVDTIDGADFDEYGTYLGREWGVGDKKKNNGVVLLLAVKDREFGIFVGYGLEGAIPDAKAAKIRTTYGNPHFKSGDYSEGMLAVYNSVVNEVYNEYGLQPDKTYDYEAMNSQESLFTWWRILIIIVVILLYLFISRNKRFAMFLPIGFPRGFGGGRFGGGGGFGGGRFGGGGGSFGGGGRSGKF
ncbi:MAG: TPM domain-containing protein [bacterium]|nr:TPM domain-containing protein [bacterium]